MGEVLKFETLDGGLRKKNERKFLRCFAKMTQLQDLFRLNFGLKDLFGAARNVHKNKHKKKLEDTS